MSELLFVKGDFMATAKRSKPEFKADPSAGRKVAPPAGLTEKGRAAKFLKDALPFMRVLDGWELFIESSGGWCWSLPPENGGPCAVYATPFWDDLAGIPLEFLAGDDDEGRVSAFVPFALTGDTRRDAEAYLAAIRPFLMLRPNHKALTNGDFPSLKG